MPPSGGSQLELQAVEGFTAALPAAARRSLPAAGILAEALGEVLRSARVGNESLALSPAAFLAHLAGFAPADRPVLDWLGDLQAADLYLACACARGEPAALQLFESRFGAQVLRAVRGLDATVSVADEVKQLMRQQLFLGSGEAPPKIASYAGMGPLSSWVQAMAIRLTLNLRRADKPERAVPLDQLDDDQLPVALRSPESELLQAQHREHFVRAFRTALSSLPDREINVLRLHFVHGVSLDRLGELHGVHRATVARWIATSREQLFKRTCRELSEQARLTSSELASLMELAKNGVETSLNTLLSPMAGDRS